MFKITFIDSVKKSKQIWNIEEAERTYIFGRSCLNFFTSKGVKENECYVDIFSESDTVISKDQIYVKLSLDNILEIKFKNKLRTFSADREYSKIDGQKYEYYYIQADRTQKLKFKADTNKYIIRVEYDSNLNAGIKFDNKKVVKNSRKNKIINESITKRNFSIDSLANIELSQEKVGNDELVSDKAALSIESDEIIEASAKIQPLEESQKQNVSSNNDEELNPVEISKPKERKKTGRKPNEATVAALARKQQQKNTVNNLMHTLYEAQKKNQEVEVDIDATSEKSINIKGFVINKEENVENTINTNHTINFKRFRKRKFGDLDSEKSNISDIPVKLAMKKYVDPSIPTFKTMEDLEVDTRHMSKRSIEKLKRKNTLPTTRNKTTETKHLFLDE